MKNRWRRVREATAGSSAGTLERGGPADTVDMDDDNESTEVRTCPSCNGTGIKNGLICPTCNGAGIKVKESTGGSYWLYFDDPGWERLQEAGLFHDEINWDSLPESNYEWAELREAPRTFSTDVRKKYSAAGVAMSDGSYPIPDADALKRAISSYGRNATAAVKAHIIKRARALGLTDKLPDGWTTSKEARTANFGGKKAPPFGKKGGKGGKGGKGSEDDDEDKLPPWLRKNKESEAMLSRLDDLEQVVGIWKSLSESQPASMTPTFSQPVRVKTSDGREGYRVTLLEEGRGNKDDDQWYKADAIKELCESGVCEGMQAFSNHPALDEEEKRPERDVKELVGTYHDVKYVQESGKARADGILVPLTLDEHHPRYGWIVTLAEAAARSKAPQPICGISLYGLSAGDDGDRPDGTYGRMVDIIRPMSGDVVTNAGAGGGFIRQIMESARMRRDTRNEVNDPMKLAEYQRRYRDAAKRVREAASDEDRASALEELTRLDSESIDRVPDSIEALREAAPKLVEEIETQVKNGESQTIEQLREANTRLTGQLSSITNVIGVTDALHDAGVTDPTELKYFAGKAQERGLREADKIKEMVETERAYTEKQAAANVEKMREALGLNEDADVVGAIGRLPFALGAPASDGALETLRESGIPLKTIDKE